MMTLLRRGLAGTWNVAALQNVPVRKHVVQPHANPAASWLRIADVASITVYIRSSIYMVGGDNIMTRRMQRNDDLHGSLPGRPRPGRLPCSKCEL